MVRNVITCKNPVFSAYLLFRISKWHLWWIKAVSIRIKRVYKLHLFGVLKRCGVRKCSKWALYVRWVHGPALPHPILCCRKVLAHLTKILRTFSTCCRFRGIWASDGGGSLYDSLLGKTEKRTKEQHLVIVFWGTHGGSLLRTLIFSEKLTKLLSHGGF